jgi:transcriptional regulator
MYIPHHFREERSHVLQELIRTHSLATLVTLGPEGLLANHLPMILDIEPAPWGTLRGHLARANPQWRESRTDVAALAIFQGPAAYISPSWYPSKAQHGRVVPTYNYVVVHARGLLRVVEDPEWLRQHLRALTSQHEAAFAEPWSIDDAPAEYINQLLETIVGIEIRVAALEGKWKVSQNRPAADRSAVVDSLRATGNPTNHAMARFITER